MNSTYITVNGGFPKEDLTKDQGPLVFKVSGIRNPRSLKTTATMAVTTFDSKGYTIEYKKDQMSVTMLEVNPVSYASVSPTALVVGGLTSYSFSI